jgi:hypothetical protein
MTSTLVIALAPFSDAALAVGPLAARRAARPDERITFAGTVGVCEVVASLGLADEVWPTGGSIRPSAVAAEPGVAVAVSGSRDLLRTGAFLMRARRARFDAVVDLFPQVGSMIASWLAVGARARSSTSRYVDAFLKSKAAAERPIDPVDRAAVLLGVDPDAAGLDLRADAEADRWFERALGAIGYRGGGPVVVAHTAGKWSHEAFAEVVDRLRGAFSAWPVALDTPREGGLARRLAGALGGSVLGVGAPSGARFVAALERASLVITDDMSVAYLAWLGHVPSVLVEQCGPYALAPRAGLDIVRADRASDPAFVYDVACKLISKQRTASLFERD